jgi:hypothetical protein
MHKCSCVGISIPTEVLVKIDQERGDISRSKYILRILEKKYLVGYNENGKSKI